MTIQHGNIEAASPEPIRIGVWLPLLPGTKLRGEGLMRMLNLIATGFHSRNAKYVIVTPHWMREEIESEFRDMPPAERALYELYIPSSFFGWLYTIFDRRRAKRDNIDHRLEKLREKQGLPLGRRIFGRTTHWAMRNISYFIPLILVILAAAAFGGIAYAPTLAAGAVVLAAAIAVAMVAAVLARILARSSLFQTVANVVVETLQAPWNLIKKVTRAMGGWWLKLIDEDFSNQAKRASRRAKVDCWFTLHITADSARYLKGPKIAMFADFVFFDCPSMGNHEWLRRARGKTYRLLKHTNAVVTLSQHVRDNELLRYFPVARKADLAMIDHAPIDLSADLPMPVRGNAAKTPESLKAAGDAVRRHIRDNLRKEVLRRGFRMSAYKRYYDNAFRYLDGFPIEETTFVFASTQIRPYKNLLNLVKAIEILIRRDGMPVKLIISGIFSDNEEVFEYVQAQGLHFDVLSVPRLSRTAHAAMYHCASLTVHPTFFEGGQGAFPLGESLSVGTPVLLSRHPGTVADADSEEYRAMLFDPYSVEEMAERIAAGLANASELFERQNLMYAQRKSRRSWDDVSGEYLAVFRGTIERVRSGKTAKPVKAV